MQMVAANLMLGKGGGGGGGGRHCNEQAYILYMESRNTLCRFMLQKVEISASLLGHMAHIQT